MTKESAHLHHRHVVYSVSAPPSRGPRARPNCETEIIGIGGDHHDIVCLAHLSYTSRDLTYHPLQIQSELPGIL